MAFVYEKSTAKIDRESGCERKESVERRQPVDNEFLNISGRQGNMPALNFNFTTARGGVRFFIFLSILYFSGSFFSWFITCNINCSRREEIQFGQTLKAPAAELLGVFKSLITFQTFSNI